MKAVLYTTLALLAFAANSVFCRLALGNGDIDAAGFTLIRLFSGAMVLSVVVLLTHRRDSQRSKGSWSSSWMLFIYAICFSYAYISLDTGTGALLLFGSVQITMIAISLRNGNHLHASEWIGLAMAFLGLCYLVLPGISTPSANGFILMTIAGIAWGIYTLRGKASSNPLADTGYNFIRTLPLQLILLSVAYPMISLTTQGVILAILSGVVASGIGYSIWYLALPLLSTTQAAVLQLSVPIIAAFGGLIWIGEGITQRLMISAVLTLGGILLVIMGRRYHQRPG